MPGDNGIIGSILDDRYQIESKLGEGGMGAVYLARNLQIGKPVAIKVLHGGLVADERVEARFTQEISVMSSLSHPNLITIQDAGIIPTSGIPYFVMEYLEARSLDHILKENGPLGIEQVQAVLYQVADALAHAHKKGVVHRDLKPANVLLLKSEGQYFVKVVDLGIAKAIRPDGAA
ncbi:MAG TPA: serine/threonine-protein kinase, partial [Candidatus Melainabacteria bacterium]|nr:serine/threonine-protein kinase [Candidatus Melainabacteria bacterium]